MSDHYILNNKTPEAVDLDTWAKWFGTADRTVAKTEIQGILISTVFLGLDHNWSMSGPPILFETMAFTDYDEAQNLPTRRYATWEEAEVGHMETVEELQAIIAEKETQ